MDRVDNGNVTRLSAILRAVSGFIYGLSALRAFSRPSLERAKEMASDISLDVSPQWITDSAAVRPRWRMPMSTVGICADGTSTMPLEEFPTTAPMCLSVDR